MNRNHAKEVSISRFSLRQVSATARNALVVDVGCQRCQHCMLRRFGVPAEASESPPNLEEAAPSVSRGETRSHLCQE